MKFQLILLLSIAALLEIVQVQADVGKCEDCLPNFVQCLTPTTYKVCINGESFGDVQRCAEGTFCSNASTVCMPANSIGVDFVYGTENTYSNGNCGECLDDDVFTCMDETRFTMCENRNVLVACNTGEFCVKGLFKIFNKMCVTQNTIDDLGLSYSCSNNDFVIDCIANKRQNETRSNFNIANRLDFDTCGTYIYCEPQVNDMKATLSICTDKIYPYFHNKQGRCTKLKTDTCGI